MSGYELKQISEKTINHFWQYSHSQIYPALKKLQAQGMVQKKPEFVGEKAKFIYSITNKGTKTLKKWLLDPYTEEEKRMPFLLKIFFHGNDEQVAGLHYQKYLADNESKIKGLRALQQEFDQQLKKEKQRLWEREASLRPDERTQRRATIKNRQVSSSQEMMRISKVLKERGIKHQF